MRVQISCRHLARSFRTWTKGTEHICQLMCLATYWLTQTWITTTWQRTLHKKEAVAAADVQVIKMDVPNYQRSPALNFSFVYIHKNVSAWLEWLTSISLSLGRCFHIPPLLRAGSVCGQFKSQSKAKKPETWNLRRNGRVSTERNSLHFHNH